MTLIHNPILRGFNPDPSILRVGDDFYIATSTFEWFPGVRIHHSRDLVHWRLLTRALTRVEQLDMLGIGDSCGIWAPCLSYCGRSKLFHLIYTNVQHRGAYFIDAPNYLVTAQDPAGPWSDPVFLNCRGFDPSMFHDDDGRKWLVQMQCDYRPGRHRFSGIILQEYGPKQKKMVGESRNIFPGSPRGLTEGPHLYKRNGWCYLMVAEGGTGYNHTVTVARSRQIDGPYELDPRHLHLLTSSDAPGAAIQKAGHASLVDTPDGRWYIAHLCSRPLPNDTRCPLGRETALQEVEWTDDGWLRLVGGGHVPKEKVPAPDLPPAPFDPPPEKNTFDQTEFDPRLDSLRVPIDPSWASLTARPGWVRMIGRQALQSPRKQSMLARRVSDFRFLAETKLEFAPSHFHHMAGLTAYYDTGHHHYALVTYDSEFGRCLDVLTCDHRQLTRAVDQTIALPADGPVYLRMEMEDAKLWFSYSLDGKAWTRITGDMDPGILSDDYVQPMGFTGAYVGICVHDMTGHGIHADFEYLLYHGMDERG